MRQPRAILFEPVRVDLFNVRDFGELVILFDESDGKNRRALLDTEELTQQVLTALRAIDYDPDIDFIVTTGHNLAVSILTAVCASYYGVFKCAVYNHRSREYLERKLGQCEVCP